MYHRRFYDAMKGINLIDTNSGAELEGNVEGCTNFARERCDMHPPTNFQPEECVMYVYGRFIHIDMRAEHTAKLVHLYA
jgi:hypothetical protein